MWLDVTFDPRAAIFFASFDFTANSFVASGYGHLFIWSKKDIRSSPLYFNTPIVDLKPIADVLSDALKVHSSRPQAQVAGSIRIDFGNRHAEEVLKELRTVILFKREDACEVAGSVDHYFPNDSLYEELNRFENLYFERWESAPPLNLIGPS